MDTLGRTTLKLTAMNVVDDFRGREVIVSLLRGRRLYRDTHGGANDSFLLDHLRLPLDCRLQEASRRLLVGSRCVRSGVVGQQARCQHREKSIDFVVKLLL